MTAPATTATVEIRGIIGFLLMALLVTAALCIPDAGVMPTGGVMPIPEVSDGR